MAGVSHATVAWGTLEMRTKFWLENLKRGDRTEDLGVDERIILEWILGKWGGKAWTGCI
jgi:hypothetical protein